MSDENKEESYQILQEPIIINETIQIEQLPPLKPKKKSKLFLTIMAVVLVAAIVTGGSIGGIKLITSLSSGILNKTSGSAADILSAFTINKLTDTNEVQATNTDAITTNTATTEKLTLQQVAQKVIPSVVCIQNLQTARTTTLQTAGEGSGIIMTSDGYIITNAHVVSEATALKVITSDGTSYEAKLIGIDTSTDLALIKIETTGLTPAEFGDATQLQVADTVMAIGNPGGLEFNSSVTIGYVSALGRSIETAAGYTMKCIQTDAAINPGNSGGALVNMYGQVIGINSSKIVATGFEGLGFAITINEAQPIINDLKNNGYVKDRAMLGIGYQMIDEMMSNFYKLKVGLYVQTVNNENVTTAGIEKGDVITQVEGKDITSAADLTSILKTKKPGETIALTVYKTKTSTTITASVILSEYTGS